MMKQKKPPKWQLPESNHFQLNRSALDANNVFCFGCELGSVSKVVVRKLIN